MYSIEMRQPGERDGPCTKAIPHGEAVDANVMTEPEHMSRGPLTTTRAEIKKACRRAPKHQRIERRDAYPELTQQTPRKVPAAAEAGAPRTHPARSSPDARGAVAPSGPANAPRTRGCPDGST